MVKNTIAEDSISCTTGLWDSKTRNKITKL